MELIKTSRLNPDLKSEQVQDFEGQLLKRLVGQERAVRRMSDILQAFQLGMNPPNRPVGSVLFLGPTGSGKTHMVEAAAEILFGKEHAFIKIDCGEFQHSHEIAKLIGSPPGYVGHRETSPILTQEALDQFQNGQALPTFVLFDEIEKASDALWKLMLGVLDKATLTLGDNRRVDFSKCVVVMTSNLGGSEIARRLNGSGLGFTSARQTVSAEETDSLIYRISKEAARQKFPPEFMNRIDKVIVFRPLKPEHLARILDIELGVVQQRLLDSNSARFVFDCTEAAREFLLKEGTDAQYGARPLKRTIERFLVYKFANLVATRQLETGDLVQVDLCPSMNRLVFMKTQGGALAGIPALAPAPIQAACTQANGAAASSSSAA